MVRIAPSVPLAEILEDDWDRQLFRGPKSLATMLGWTTYHTLRSRGSRSGYPDRTCVRERIVFAELKREKTKPTAEQVDWLDRIAAAGGEVYLWHPSDLEEIGNVLGRRRLFLPESRSLAATSGSDPDWNIEPGSMWLPGAGRRDGR
jgi:hypothetical protein